MTTQTSTTPTTVTRTPSAHPGASALETAAAAERMARLFAEVRAAAACVNCPAPGRSTPGPGAPEKPVILRDAEAAFQLVAADPALRVDIFESDWAQLDRDRERACALGLATRINFHHQAAYLCPFVRFLLARSQTRVVMIDRAA